MLDSYFERAVRGYVKSSYITNILISDAKYEVIYEKVYIDINCVDDCVFMCMRVNSSGGHDSDR